MAKSKAVPISTRPMPPATLFEPMGSSFTPAADVANWALATFIREDAQLYNADHAHLEFANFSVLWATAGFAKQGRFVLGQCEEVTFRCGPWQKQRQELQMREWFGFVPGFLITLDASYCSTCSDAEFCALLEHELYHIGHKKDDFGQPAFCQDGTPKLGMRGHDVEEFVGVVRRYGASPEVKQLIDAAKTTPEVVNHTIARACGTCLLRAA